MKFLLKLEAILRLSRTRSNEIRIRTHCEREREVYSVGSIEEIQGKPNEELA